MRVFRSLLLMVLVLVSQVAYAQVTNLTTLSVVLVTFEDDMPHGYTRTGTALTPTVGTSYTLNDFERKFGVSGTFNHEAGITLSNRNPEELPAAYGSVKDYFYEMSGEELDFDVRIVNREDPNHSGFPEWIVMGMTRAQYAGMAVGRSSILHDALIRVRGYITAEYTADEIASDFADFPRSIFLRTADVVVFVYSGWQSGNRNGLHPHARPNGSCYVTGERQGGHRRPGPADRFTGIGIHAHEMGHILGLRHPQGDPGDPDYVTTDDYNPYADQTPGVSTYERQNADGTTTTETVANWGGGSIAGWCTMHQGSDGPATEGSHRGDGAFMYSWASCPNLYNPFYIRDLRNAFMWTTTSTAIDESHRTQQHVRIDPAPEHYYLIDAPGGELMLEFRDADSFGKYNQWYQFDEAPGLLVWRRNRVNLADPTRAPLPRIIPADNRRIFNALAQPVSGETTRLWNDSFVYPWIDITSDPFGAVQEVSTGDNLVEANGLRSTIESMASYQGEEDPEVANRMALPDYMQLVGPAPGRNWPAHRVTPDWATDESHFARPPSRTDANGNRVGDDDPLHVALRNIVVNRGTDPHAFVNIFHGYWEGTLTQSATWSGDVYVGGDLIVPDGITLTIGNGTTVHFLKPRASDVNSNEIAEIVVRDRGTLDIGTDVTFTSAHERKNESDEAEDREDEDHGLIVEDGGIVTIEGLTFYDGTHTLSGPVTVGGDLVVGDGTNAATLRLEAGTEVRFASTDAESDGQDDARVELIVENGGVLQAGAGEIIFRSSSDSPSASDWYGIRVESGGSADLSGATIQDAHRCVQSHDSPTTTPAPVTMSDATELTHCGLTVSLVPSPPRVGHPVSASVVDVTGTVTGNWQWQRRSGSESWEDITLPARTTRQTRQSSPVLPGLSVYTPVLTDRGQMLRVRMHYQDGSDLYNYVHSAVSQAVAVGRPHAPGGLNPEEGDGHVVLNWNAAVDNGSSLLNQPVSPLARSGRLWFPRPGFISYATTGSWRPGPGPASASWRPSRLPSRRRRTALRPAAIGGAGRPCLRGCFPPTSANVRPVAVA